MLGAEQTLTIGKLPTEYQSEISASKQRLAANQHHRSFLSANSIDPRLCNERTSAHAEDPPRTPLGNSLESPSTTPLFRGSVAGRCPFSNLCFRCHEESNRRHLHDHNHYHCPHRIKPGCSVFDNRTLTHQHQ